MSAGFLWGAAAAPDRIALCWRDRQVSYQELHWHVARASATLVPSAEASSVLGLETAVGFAPEPTLPHLVCLLAHAEQGVPCVLLHPRWPAPERQRALAELPPITLRQPSPTLEHSLLRADVSPASVGFARATFSEERALAVLFTSGSSSGAKAVVLSRRAFHAAANASAERLGWQSEDRWLLSLPLAHVGGLSVLIRCLTAGQTVVLPDPEVALTTESLARCIAEEAPTLLSLVPTQLSRLLGLSGWNLPRSVRAVLVGGASCPPALVQEAMQRGWPLRRTYGMTETCAQVATAHQDQAPGAALPLVAGVEARIQDGVIQLKARSLLSAYVRRGQICTALDAEGWFTTGDRGSLTPEGDLLVHGRGDALIISGGENVDPLEVEALLSTYPPCSVASVIGLDDQEWGQKVAAAVVLDEAADRSHFEAWIQSQMAPHQRPKQLLYLSVLPLTASGKVDRQRVADLLRSREPGPWRG